ncbi:hypothetical protein D8B26_002604 [Coccidioides posadasii str. Silveira]|uniref:uncharacterized protein n=1 Tax=Coccidioides posadasii (strain RMSCC 757 / Silveira) TaxID=443226 RepID=UPI001BF0DAFB|nr:hypothetical protein D8B26_002604 [Coccidioides posadasii str. Silveira]
MMIPCTTKAHVHPDILIRGAHTTKNWNDEIFNIQHHGKEYENTHSLHRISVDASWIHRPGPHLRHSSILVLLRQPHEPSQSLSLPDQRRFEITVSTSRSRESRLCETADSLLYASGKQMTTPIAYEYTKEETTVRLTETAYSLNMSIKRTIVAQGFGCFKPRIGRRLRNENFLLLFKLISSAQLMLLPDFP